MIKKIILEDSNIKPKKPEYTFELDTPKKQWKNYQGEKFHRFFFIENNKELENILRRIIPKLVEVNQNKKRNALLLPRK